MPGFKFSEPVDGGAVLLPSIQILGNGYPVYLGNCDIIISPLIIGYESTLGNGAVSIPKVNLTFSVVEMNEGTVLIPSVSVFGYSTGVHFEFFDVRFSPLLVSVVGFSHLDAIGVGIIRIPSLGIVSSHGGKGIVGILPVEVDGCGRRTGEVGFSQKGISSKVSVVGRGFLSEFGGGSLSISVIPAVAGTGVVEPARKGNCSVVFDVSLSGTGAISAVGNFQLVVPFLLIDAFGRIASVASTQVLGDIAVPAVSIVGSAFIQEDFEFSESDDVLRYSFDRRLL